MVGCAKSAIRYYIKKNNLSNFKQLSNVFGQAVSNTCQASKNIKLTAKFGNVFVSKDWREYGNRGTYWDEFVKCCKKVDIKIEKQAIRYQPDKKNFKFV